MLGTLRIDWREQIYIGHVRNGLKKWRSQNHNLYFYIFLKSQNVSQLTGVGTELLRSLFKERPQKRGCNKNKRKLFFDPPQPQRWRGKNHFSWWGRRAVNLRIQSPFMIIAWLECVILGNGPGWRMPIIRQRRAASIQTHTPFLVNVFKANTFCNYLWSIF